MNNLFETEEQKNATERILAAFKIRNLNEHIDNLVADILKYAKEMDDLLEQHNLEKRFLNKVSSLSEGAIISLDDDLNNIDFRVREILEDLAKRINTRINLVKDDDKQLKTIEQKYDIDNFDFEKDLELSKLTEENFV